MKEKMLSLLKRKCGRSRTVYFEDLKPVSPRDIILLRGGGIIPLLGELEADGYIKIEKTRSGCPIKVKIL